MMARNVKSVRLFVLGCFSVTSLIPVFIYAQEQESAKQEESAQESQPVEKEVAEEDSTCRARRLKKAV